MGVALRCGLVCEPSEGALRSSVGSQWGRGPERCMSRLFVPSVKIYFYGLYSIGEAKTPRAISEQASPAHPVTLARLVSVEDFG